MNQTTHIRPVGKKDIPALAAIIRQSFRDVADRFGLTPRNCPRHPSNCDDSWVEDDMQKGVSYYLLEQDSRAAGCVALKRSAPTICLLERLAVLPQSRGKGLGQLLVHHVFAEAKRQGSTAVNIAIIADHEELKNWYQRLGFTEKETKAFPSLPFRVMFLACELK
jgi:N-acetylglutamate synthase-like GNAT family acetyltransferase